MSSNWGSSKDDKSIDNPEWSVVQINPNGIVVTWQEKYGAEQSESCIGLWENKTEYMLTWKDEKKVVIEKSNLNSIRFTNTLMS